MARETIYVVQAFNAGKGKSLRADVPIPCRSAETARSTAQRLAGAKAGVVAYSTAGDAELGDYDDEPIILFKTGQLPAHFEDTWAEATLPPWNRSRDSRPVRQWRRTGVRTENLIRRWFQFCRLKFPDPAWEFPALLKKFPV